MSYSSLVRDRKGRWTRTPKIINARIISLFLLVAFILLAWAYYAHAATKNAVQGSFGPPAKETCLTYGQGTGHIESHCADKDSTLVWGIQVSNDAEVAARAKADRSWSKDELVGLIKSEAARQGYADVDLALKLVDCESKFNPSRINYRHNSPPSVDRGLWQMNSHWQARVSDGCSFDPVCSTKEAITMLKAGKAHLWSCYALIH